MFFGVVVVLALMIPLVAVVLDSQLGRALAARLERGRGTDGDAGLGERVAGLESEVERLAAEVQRLEEQSEFLHRLLEAKPAAGEALPNGERGD
ncbi:MAG TPA: hypothetical protein VF188_07800 [Longimicrobiales bacterium]